MNNGRVLAVVVACGLTILGWACVFRANSIAEKTTREYHRGGKLVHRWPFTNIVVKSWYPIYLRGIGIVIWIFAVLLVMATWLVRNGQSQ